MTKTTKRAEHIPITKAEVRKALRNIIDTRPDAVNPMRVDDAYMCAYHRGRGKNVRRCLIGQLGHEFGLPRPAADADGVNVLTSKTENWDGAGFDGVDAGRWAGRFTEGARKFMVAAQAVADNGSDPIRWGDISFLEIERLAKDVTLFA